MEEKNKKKENFNLKEKKENTVNSLFQVEHFLKDFRSIIKGVKLYNIIKR